MRNKQFVLNSTRMEPDYILRSSIGHIVLYMHWVGNGVKMKIWNGGCGVGAIQLNGWLMTFVVAFFIALETSMAWYPQDLGTPLNI